MNDNQRAGSDGRPMRRGDSDPSICRPTRSTKPPQLKREDATLGNASDDHTDGMDNTPTQEGDVASSGKEGFGVPNSKLLVAESTPIGRKDVSEAQLCTIIWKNDVRLQQFRSDDEVRYSRLSMSSPEETAEATINKSGEVELKGCDDYHNDVVDLWKHRWTSAYRKRDEPEDDASSQEFADRGKDLFQAQPNWAELSRGPVEEGSLNEMKMKAMLKTFPLLSEGELSASE